MNDLFTNVRYIILDRIYTNNEIQTKIKKRTLKKLILDSCQKTTFSFNSVLCEQIEGVSMGASLGPVLANIILTELEKVIVKPLIETGVLKFYIRYVDDTLVLVKREDLQAVLHQLNSFHPHLKFTVDDFPDGNVHFLDLQIDKNNTDIYYKDTHTAQYTNFNSFAPWSLRTAWIKSLYHRALNICSTKKNFDQQIRNIGKFMSWNGFPKYVTKSLIKRLGNPKSNPSPDSDDVAPSIWLNVPYGGNKGEFLVKSLCRKLRRYLKKDTRIITRYRCKYLSFLCSTKDRIPTEQRSNIIYEITCPGCGERYVGKTDRCLNTRMIEHGTRIDQPMYRHLTSCTDFIDYTKLFGIHEPEWTVSFDNHKLNAVLQNHKILDFNPFQLKWGQLSFLEAYYIKKLKPKLNNGIKASKEFVLFIY